MILLASSIRIPPFKKPRFLIHILLNNTNQTTAREYDIKKTLHKLNQFFEKTPDRMRRHRLKVIAASLILLVFAGFGLPRLKVDMSMESFLNPNDPILITYDYFREYFGADESVYIVYKANDGDVFSYASLAALSDLQKELENKSIYLSENDTSPLKRIIEIKSLINVNYMEVQGDTLTARDFIGNTIPKTEAEREAVRKQALEQKDYLLFYLSTDSKWGAIFIRTNFGAIPEDEPSETAETDVSFSEEDFEDTSTVSKPISDSQSDRIRFKRTDMFEYGTFMNALNEILHEKKYQEALTFYPVGNPVIMKFFVDVFGTEMPILMTILMGVMFLVLVILFRSLSGVVWSILIVIFSSLFTIGIVCWLGFTMSLMMEMIILMIFIFGVSDAVHILSGYMYFRKNGIDHQTALRKVYGKSGLACFLTSLTTTVGMLALVFVSIPSIRVFGFTSALGIMTAFAVTLFLFPILLDFWHPVSDRLKKSDKNIQRNTSTIQKFLLFIEPFSFRYPKTIVAVFFIIGLISAYGLTKVRVDSNYLEIIKKGHPTRQAHEIVDQFLGGTQSMEILLQFEKIDAMKDPDVLIAMEKLQKDLEVKQDTYVVKTMSLVNAVKDSYKVLNENREDMYILPKDRNTVAQTLLLFDSANYEDRTQLVSDSYTEGRITIRLYNYGSREYLGFIRDVEHLISQYFDPLKEKYPDERVEVTGNLAIMMRLCDYISRSQIQSFALALVVITAILFIVFGSLKYGVVAVIPNLFPIVVTFGVMGIFDFALDADTLIIAPIVIGIAVDDTIHFLTHFRAYLIETGDVRKTILHTIREVGQAIVFTTLIIVLGFLVQTSSSHQGMANFGFLTAIAFISALLADLILLPALCVLVDLKPHR